MLTRLAFADTITLASGKAMIGKLNFDAKNAITIAPKDGPSVRLELRDVITLKVDNQKISPTARVATLIDGTRVAATDVLSFDERELRLKRPDGSVFSVNSALVSSIDFSPAAPRPAPAANFVGAQVGDKDVAEGDVLSISPTSVKVSSVLFGVQELDTAKSVRAVYLRSKGISKAAYIGRTRDGSIWQSSAVTIDAGKLTFVTDLAGPVTVPANDLLSLGLGPASADDLSGLTGTADQSLTLSPGQQQNVDVAGKYHAVVLTFRVPDTFMPTRTARLIVLADDKEIAKSDPLTSLDAPVTITRSLDHVKQLTLKLDVTGPAQLGIAGAISEGRLIHAQ